MSTFVQSKLLLFFFSLFPSPPVQLWSTHVYTDVHKLLLREGCDEWHRVVVVAVTSVFKAIAGLAVQMIRHD